MEIQVEVPIRLTDTSRHLAFGWANVFRTVEGEALVDTHRETIDTVEAVEAIEDAVYRYVLESRSGDEEHVNYGIARLVETMIWTDEKRAAIARHSAMLSLLSEGESPTDEEIRALTEERLGMLRRTIVDGWWVGYRVDDPAVWAKVEKGEYSMFSIVGRALRRPREAA